MVIQDYLETLRCDVVVKTDTSGQPIEVLVNERAVPAVVGMRLNVDGGQSAKLTLILDPTSIRWEQ